MQRAGMRCGRHVTAAAGKSPAAAGKSLAAAGKAGRRARRYPAMPVQAHER
jgi:hypothetical protein